MDQERYRIEGKVNADYLKNNILGRDTGIDPLLSVPLGHLPSSGEVVSRPLEAC